MPFASLTFVIATACAVSSETVPDTPAPTSRELAVAIDRVPMAVDEPVDIQRLAGGLNFPWSLAFLPGGDILITEKHGGIRIVREGKLQGTAVAGGPATILAHEDSGLLDLAIDPDFAANRLVYVAFAEGTEDANRTALWRARFDGNLFTDGRVIFRARPDKAKPSHPGGRLLFLRDKTLLLTIGDGYDYKTAAQDFGSHLGKTLRLTREGAAAPGNPFIDRDGALPEIWTLGHRNAQGLAMDAATGEIWLHEHGPRGGDEVNRLTAGANYGWPTVTHGIDYDGTVISERSMAGGIHRSSFYWAPSIAPSGLAVYRGDAIRDWQGKLLVGGLASRSISVLRMGKDTGFFVEEARILGPLRTRIRDVRQGPDGLVYLLTDEAQGQLLRLVPRTQTATSP